MILLLPLHILDKMSGKFNYFTYIEIIGIAGVAILSLYKLLGKFA